MKGNIFEAYANAVAKQFHLELDEMFNKDSEETWLTPDKCFITYVWKDLLEFLIYKGIWQSMAAMFFIPLSFMAIRKLRKWLKKMKTTRLSLS